MRFSSSHDSGGRRANRALRDIEVNMVFALLFRPSQRVRQILRFCGSTAASTGDLVDLQHWHGKQLREAAL